MKTETVKRKVKFIEDNLNRIENGLYTGLTIGKITDTIAWLWKYRYIDYETMSKLVARTTYIINAYKPD